MEKKQIEKNNIVLPAFQTNHIPSIKLKSIRFQKFKAFEDYTLNFYDKDGIKDFNCFIGQNGCGKSTVLHGIQLLFSNLNARTKEILMANLGKEVRHVKKDLKGIFGKDDFKITAKFVYGNNKEYAVIMNKSGFVKDHPKKIKEFVYRLCYLARFDQELNIFQIDRTKWPIFKSLFESITGFTIEENTDINKYLGDSSDPNFNRLLKDYVLGFYIIKPYEVIFQKECSDGEKKIIKTFSTLLTLEYTPKIILIDNIETHVEIGRHIKLIEALKKCFPDSQIFSTTHSYYVSKIFGKKSGVYDLRLVNAPKIIKDQPWRLYVMDEIKDHLIKLKSFNSERLTKDNDKIILSGEKLLRACNLKINNLQQFNIALKIFLKESSDFFVSGLLPKL